MTSLSYLSRPSWALFLLSSGSAQHDSTGQKTCALRHYSQIHLCHYMLDRSQNESVGYIGRPESSVAWLKAMTL